MKTLLYLSLSLILFSCSNAPESYEDQATDTLKNYVQEFFKVKSYDDLKKISSLTSSTLKSELEKIDQTMFNEIFTKSNFQLVNFTVKDRRQVGKDRFSFIYEIKLISHRGGRHTEVNKKIAFVAKEQANSKWTLTEVRNINSTINYADELSIVP